MRVGERLGFAAAGFGLSLVYFWVALYLLAYLYDGTGLSTRGIATLTMILALGKGWEAIADLLIGLLIDRTRTRWGTFRIYPLITALPLGLLTVLLFTAPGGTETRKLAVIGILYVLWSAAFTCGDVPYWSLSTVITTDYAARSRLVSWARTAGMLALAVVAVVGTPLAVALSGPHAPPGQASPAGWWRGSVLVATVGMALFTLAFLTTREKVPHRADPLPFRQAVRVFTSNRPLFLVLLSGVLCFGQFVIQVGGAVVSGIVFGDIRVFSMLGGSLIGSMTVGALLTPALLRRVTRKRLLVASLIGLGAACAMLYLVGYRSLPTVLTLFAVAGLVQGVHLVTQTMIVGDTVDLAEVRSGERIDGASFAGLTFTSKLGGALATMVFGLVIAWVGYEAGQPITDTMRDDVWLSVTIIPAISTLVATIPYRWYDVPERELAAMLRRSRAARGVHIVAPESDVTG